MNDDRSDKLRRRVNEMVHSLRCDGYGTEAALHCGQEPFWAVAIDVPTSRGMHRHMTTLHYCASHRNGLMATKDNFLASFIDVRKMTEIEAEVREHRGDASVFFDEAAIRWIRVRTPEYRAYLASMLVRETV